MLRTLSAIEGIIGAHHVTGAYDVITFVDVADTDALGELVIPKIQTVKGIARTPTCVVI